MALTKEQLKQFRQLLITERAKFVAEIRSIAQDTAKSPREASGDLSAYTIHMADMSSDTYERELAMNIASTEQEVLYQIDEALKRMDEGTYGTCQECSTPIAISPGRAMWTNGMAETLRGDVGVTLMPCRGRGRGRPVARGRDRALTRLDGSSVCAVPFPAGTRCTARCRGPP